MIRTTLSQNLRTDCRFLSSEEKEVGMPAKTFFMSRKFMDTAQCEVQKSTKRFDFFYCENEVIGSTK